MPIWRQQLSGEETAAALSGSTVAAWVIVIAAPFLMYFGYQWHKSQVRDKASNLVRQAQATLFKYDNSQQDGILRAMAAVQSARIADDTSRLNKANEELEQALGGQASSSRSAAAPRVVYDKPKFLLHIKAVGVPRGDGQGDQWVTDMYFAGLWVPTTREPDSEGRIKLAWGTVIPVWCLADERYGPFSSSDELCPKAQERGARFSRDDAQALGCAAR